MISCFYDVYKWLDDVEVEQVVLTISFLIWEMHQTEKNYNAVHVVLNQLQMNNNSVNVVKFIKYEKSYLSGKSPLEKMIVLLFSSVNFITAKCASSLVMKSSE